MRTIVQYSPEPELVPLFREIPFAYSLNWKNWIILTTLNRVRKYMAEVFGVTKASKNLIKAIIEDVGWAIVWQAIDTNHNFAQICAFQVQLFHARVVQALEEGEITKSP